ncbi:pentatricopeptide repeat-containing protein At4g33990 [Aristolochia californica]|uniref:pentatricopeptide repeat-containing protein At4g33990 n=1 Tax=Aristolochia californica TaxID=171875 RepID=UPI0035D96F46
MDFAHLFFPCARKGLVKPLHALLLVYGLANDFFCSNQLVTVYAETGDIRSSRHVFDHIPRKNTLSWNFMISGCVKNGYFREAANCYYQLLTNSRVRPDFFTFPVVLKCCEVLQDGKKIHCSVLKLSFENDVFVGSSLIHMYSKFGDVDDAFQTFDEMSFRDLGTWNAMIAGFCQNGKAVEALGVFEEMTRQGVRMGAITVSSVLPICAPLNDLFMGRLIHNYTLKNGFEYDVFVSNALINMYAKLGCTGEANQVFEDMTCRDLVTWNSMIAAYEQNDDPTTALKFFSGMKECGLQPDVLTLLSLASIAAQRGDTRSGRSCHDFVLKKGWITEDMLTGNALVDMYAKLGKVDDAKNVFDGMPVKDVISWNTIITGFAQNGLADEAIKLFHFMAKCDGIMVDQGTIVSILPAFSHVGALQQGMVIHGRTMRIGLIYDVFVGTCLIDMYAKCGRLTEANQLFSEVPRRSPVPWNAIISCNGIHGNGEKVLDMFREMQEEGVKPDHVTFVSLLSACSHAGLIDEGQKYFHDMRRVYSVEPNLKHYACMVDLLGRAGHLDAAYKFITSMPVRPDASVWGALLGACRIQGNVELGDLASANLFAIDSENVGYYVLLSNIYANVGEWNSVDRVRSLAKDKGLKKTPGWSSIEVNNRVHVFFTGNQSHPQCEDIYKKLGLLLTQMKSLGFVPDYSFVLQDVEEEEKEYFLTSHSERLAIAFGIINLPPQTSIKIFKNLRVCGDCHTATKFISLIIKREIIVRDSNRFHHFREDGTCSCGDYW